MITGDIKEIPLTGLTSTQSDYACPDGDLHICHNIISDGSELKAIAQPKVLFTLGSGLKEVVYVHKTSFGTAYIAIDYDGYLCYGDEEHVQSDTKLPSDTPGTAVTSIDGYVMLPIVDEDGEALTFDGGDYSITSVGNVLVLNIVNGDKRCGLNYFRCSNDKRCGAAYEYLGQYPPDLGVYFNSIASGSVNSSEEATTPSFSTPLVEDVNYQNFFMGVHNKVVADAKENNCFLRPFFVRYAYKMYDGTYTCVSSPVLVAPSLSCNPKVNVYTTNLENNGIKYTFSASAGQSGCIYFLNYSDVDLSLLKKWKDIISEVCIFVTPEIVDYSETGASLYEVTAGDVETANGTDWLYGKLGIKGGITKGDVLPYRRDGNMVEWMEQAYQFYLVNSIPLDTIIDSGKILKGNIVQEGKSLTNLTTYEQLQEEYDSRSIRVPRSMHIYNHRLNLANVYEREKSTFPIGDFSCFAEADDYHYLTGLIITVYVEKDGEYVTAQTKIPYDTDDDGNIKPIWGSLGRLSGYFFYPNQNAKYISVRTDGSAKPMRDGVDEADDVEWVINLSLPLKPHPYLNGAYFYYPNFEEFRNEEEHTYTGGGSSIGANSQKVDYFKNSNYLYTSETDNPFTFPSTGVNVIGNGEIVAIKEATKAVSEGTAFGTMPLYAFCTDGIWALSVGETGLYTAMQPVSRETLLGDDPKCATQIDNSILFLTDRGLMELSGGETRLLSHKLQRRASVVDKTSIPHWSDFNKKFAAVAANNKVAIATPEGNTFSSSDKDTAKTAVCSVSGASGEVTGNISFAWEQLNPAKSQWESIDASRVRNADGESVLTVTADDVLNVQNYRCTATVNGDNAVAYTTFYDLTDSYAVKTFTSRSSFVGGAGTATLYARVSKDDDIIETEETDEEKRKFFYQWTKFTENVASVWGNGNFTKMGNPITVKASEVNGNTLFICEIFRKGQTISFYVLVKAGKSITCNGTTYTADDAVDTWINLTNVATLNADTIGGAYILKAQYATLPSNSAKLFYGQAALTDVTWPDTGVEKSATTDMREMFYGCSSLATLETAGLDTSNVEDMASMFFGCSSLASLDVSDFSTSKVTDMSSMFNECHSLAALDVSAFDTSLVVSLRSMFANCAYLTFLDLSKWDTGNVADMAYMFFGCARITSILLENLDTSKVTAMNNIFQGCVSLTSLDLSKWDTNNVTDMSYMFYRCAKLSVLDVSNLQTGNVKNMACMFKGCASLASMNILNDNEIWDTTRVTDMREMFCDCAQLETLDVSGLWTYYVTNMSYMFRGCSKLKVLDLANFETDNVRNTAAMFMSCSLLTSLDLSNFFMQKVMSTMSMFDGCSSLVSILCSFDTSSDLTNARCMFCDCASMKSLDLSNLCLSGVTDATEMFKGCSSLATLMLSEVSAASLAEVEGMFKGCSSLTTLDVSSLNTGKVKSLVSMFQDCSQLTSLDLSGFSVEEIVYIDHMLQGCAKLSSLELPVFDGGKVTSMSCVFKDCSSLETLDLSDWRTDKVTDMSRMFENCSSLASLDILKFDTSRVTDMDDMFSGCSAMRYINIGYNFFLAELDKFYFNEMTNLGMNEDGSDNGWLSLLVETAGSAVTTTMTERALYLPSALCGQTWASDYLDTLKGNGWNVIAA